MHRLDNPNVFYTEHSRFLLCTESLLYIVLVSFSHDHAMWLLIYTDIHWL